MKINIRHAKIKDEFDLTRIISENYSKFYAQLFNVDFVKCFDNKAWKGTIIVAENNNKIIGCAGFTYDWLGFGVYNIFWVNVDKKYQNKGIGKKLIKKCIFLIKNKGTKILLGTDIPKYYKQFGFKIIDDYIDPDKRTKLYIMSLNLK